MTSTARVVLSFLLAGCADPTLAGSDLGAAALVAGPLASPPLERIAGGALATGVDLDGDGTDEIVAATDPAVASPARVTIFSGGRPVHAFTPFPDRACGVVIDGGDVDGDGRAELVAGLRGGASCPALVRVFALQRGPAGTILGAALRREVTAFAGGTHGVRLGVGDVDADGLDEIVVARGPAPANDTEVRIYAGSGALERNLGPVFAPLGRGVTLAVGDVLGSSAAEIIVGAGNDPAYGAQLKILSGTGAVLATRWMSLELRGGVEVATGDTDGDGKDEIIAGAGDLAHNGADVRVIDPSGGAGPTFLGTSYAETLFVSPNMVQPDPDDLPLPPIADCRPSPGGTSARVCPRAAWQYDKELEASSALFAGQGFGAGFNRGLLHIGFSLSWLNTRNTWGAYYDNLWELAKQNDVPVYFFYCSNHWCSGSPGALDPLFPEFAALDPDGEPIEEVFAVGNGTHWALRHFTLSSTPVLPAGSAGRDNVLLDYQRQGARFVAERMARYMAERPDLVTFVGLGSETNYPRERSWLDSEGRIQREQDVRSDYNPFMIEGFQRKMEELFETPARFNAVYASVGLSITSFDQLDPPRGHGRGDWDTFDEAANPFYTLWRDYRRWVLQERLEILAQEFRALGIPRERIHTHQVPGEYIDGWSEDFQAASIESALIRSAEPGLTSYGQAARRADLRAEIRGYRSDWGFGEHNPMFTGPDDTLANWEGHTRALLTDEPHYVLINTWNYGSLAIRETRFPEALSRVLGERMAAESRRLGLGRGARVGAADVDGDGRAELVVGVPAQSDATPVLRIFDPQGRAVAPYSLTLDTAVVDAIGDRLRFVWAKDQALLGWGPPGSLVASGRLPLCMPGQTRVRVSYRREGEEGFGAERFVTCGPGGRFDMAIPDWDPDLAYAVRAEWAGQQAICCALPGQASNDCSVDPDAAADCSRWMDLLALPDE
ncbi:MAG: FG-GAP repeat protein [Sandaracinaceae bacterium]|nr:FG-GAP repeat protein [Sandaracinaceae bacterium]